jgi:hypothetical protein
MVDFKKTEQLYTKRGLVYQKKPHEVEYERWYNSVTNPHKSHTMLVCFRKIFSFCYLTISTFIYYKMLTINGNRG